MSFLGVIIPVGTRLQFGINMEDLQKESYDYIYMYNIMKIELRVDKK